MSWFTQTTWEVSDEGTVAGIRIRSLSAFPERAPADRERADAVILEGLNARGCSSIFAENHLWTTLWVLLYWDEIFARLPGSYEPLLSKEFPVQGNDIPQDLFRGGFFESHRDLYEARRAALERADLIKALRGGRKRSRGRWTRLLEDSDRHDDRTLERVLTALPGGSLLPILDRLWSDYGEHRRGLPDLLVLDPSPTLIEVKSPKERLSEEQAAWLRYLAQDCGIPTEVLVIGWGTRKISNLKKRLAGDEAPAPKSTAGSTAGPKARPATPVGQSPIARMPRKDDLDSLSEVSRDRLASALTGSNVPAVYRSASVALRAMIREKRKAKEDWTTELAFLYAVQAEAEFLWDVPYRADDDYGMSTFEKIDREVLDRIEYPYSEIGYERIEGLGKTDRKWLVEAWGEPAQHRAPSEFHGDLRRRETEAIRKHDAKMKKRRDDEFRKSMKGLGVTFTVTQDPSPRGTSKRGPGAARQDGSRGDAVAASGRSRTWIALAVLFALFVWIASRG
ncbi:MAG: VRR-NUC domain-containing protein [Planctomycetota bacterium]